MGLEHVTLIRGHEMAVSNAHTLCIRVMVLVNTEKPPHELSNVYLRGSTNLRARGFEDEA